MKLQRYDSVGWEEMDESPTGEFVKLQDVIELLEHEIFWDGNVEPMHIEKLCVTCENIALIKGENK